MIMESTQTYMEMEVNRVVRIKMYISSLVLVEIIN